MQSDENEINSPPTFEIGEKVRVKKLIRNDGTFPGQDIGATLAKKGETGYICSIGTFLQTSYIYAVHFIERGHVVGCRTRELETAEPDRVRSLAIEEESWDLV
jgi:nitrogen fixation protein NifZ